MVIVQTERLFLRHVHILDHEPMYRIFGDAEVMRFGDGVQTKDAVQRWLMTCLEQYYRQWGFGPYAVVKRSSREVIGYCGLFFFPDVGCQPELELGYRLARAHWGYGYATEAALAVRDFAFQTLCVKRLISMIDPHNVASIRVAKKLGMQYEREVMFDGYTHPDHVYAIHGVSI
ncbi:MAG TPA: GNAT family N-acetyltransferase [Herpetosiphonaceae bacterium]